MLLCQPFDSEVLKKKKKKITSQTTPKLSCRSPAWAELATPPHSVPSRVPSPPARLIRRDAERPELPRKANRSPPHLS